MVDNIDWSNEEDCLRVVKENGLSLKWIINQTYKICLAAVKEDGYALRYIKEEFKTSELCMITIEDNKYNIRFVPKEYKNIHDAWEIMYD